MAGKRDEMHGKKTHLDYYGADPQRRDWRPYLPDDKRVAILAQQVSGAEDLIYTVLPPDETLLQRLEEAAEKTQDTGDRCRNANTAKAVAMNNSLAY